MNFVQRAMRRLGQRGAQLNAHLHWLSGCLAMFVIAAVAYANGPIDDCPSLDYEARFSQERDDRGHNFCAAIAVTNLIEEQLCLNDKADCGKWISPLSVRSCNLHMASDLSPEETAKESGSIGGDYNCVLAHGVCLEEYAPFWRVHNSFDCLETRGSEKRRDICVDKHLEEIFGRYKAVHEIAQFAATPNAIQADKQFLDLSSGKIYDEMHNGHLTKLEIRNALVKMTGVQADEFLKAILVPKSCRDNAITPAALGAKKYRYMFFDDRNDSRLKYIHPLQTRKSSLVEMLKTGSLAVNFCVSPFFPAPMAYHGDAHAFDCFRHALVINGLRQDPQSKVCQVHLHNEWGDNKSLSGWRDIDEMSGALFEMFQIVRSK